MITWPDISFGPINLWSMPKQWAFDYTQKQYDQLTTEQDNERIFQKRIQQANLLQQVCTKPERNLEAKSF